MSNPSVTPNCAMEKEELQSPASVFPLSKQEFQLHISGNAFEQVVAHVKICNTTEAPSRRAKAFARGIGLKLTRSPSDQGAKDDGRDDPDPDDNDDCSVVSNFYDCNVRTTDGIMSQTLALSKAKDAAARAEMLVYDKRSALDTVCGRIRGSLVLTLDIKRRRQKGGRQAKKRLDGPKDIANHRKPD